MPDAYSALRASTGQDAGRIAAQGDGITCHSPDYIAMQPPGKGRAFCEAKVIKMIKVYHAPIDEADGKAIAAYLADAD